MAEARDRDEEQGGRRSLLVAVAANVGIALAKLVAFVFTGSTAMLAETAHSVADSSKQGLLFLGRARECREADPEHPYGYGPERYFWALLVAVVLFPLGAGYAIFDAIGKLRDPQPIESPWWAIATLLAAMIFEGLSLRVAVTEARRAAGGESLWRFVRRTREPDVVSVLLEDAGAIVGLAFALAAVLATIATGDPRFDAAGGLAIAALLLAIALVLSIEFKSLVVGESAKAEDLELIRSTVAGEPRVRRVLAVRTLHLAPRELLVAVEVELDEALDLAEVVDAIASIKARMRERIDKRLVLHVEPAVDTAGTPAWARRAPDA